MSDTETQPTEATEPAQPDAEAAPAAEAPAEDGGAEAQAEASKKTKGPGGWQRRIAQLERQNALLTEQLGRIGPVQQADPVATPVAPEQQASDKAAEWVRGVARAEWEQLERGRQGQAAMSEFQQRTQSVRAAHPDFDEVVQSVAHIPVPAALQESLLTSSRGPEIMYMLAADPVELARISALPPLAAAREVGVLEAKLASSTQTRTATGVKPRPSPAPAPVTPVAARGPSNVKSTDQMSYDEYRAWRDSQRKT